MAARDEEALSSLYDRHKGVLFALALRLLRDRAEAEEVLSDVFLQAWRSAAGFDRNRGSVIGWLVTLCRSRAIDHLRSRGRREAAMTAFGRAEEIGLAGMQPPPGPEKDADAVLKRRRIIEAFGALSPQQRDALDLAFFGGLSHSEIASRLNEPLGTVKTRIRRGLSILRESLGKGFENAM